MNYEELSDFEREQFGKVSLEHIGNELTSLIDLRSRIAYARALLTRGVAPEKVIAVLDGEQIPPDGLDDAGKQ